MKTKNSTSLNCEYKKVIKECSDAVALTKRVYSVFKKSKHRNELFDRFEADRRMKRMIEELQIYTDKIIILQSVSR